MHRIFLILALIVSSTASMSAQNQDLEFASIDALRILSNLGREPVSRGSLPLASSYLLPREISDGTTLLGPERFLDLIIDNVDRSSWEAENAMTALVEGRFFLRNSKANIARVRKFSAGIEERIARPITVEVYRLSDDAAAEGAMGSQAADKYVAASESRLIARRDILAGHFARLGSSERREFVSGYDAEVAQESQGVDPIVHVLEHGLDVRVRCNFSPKGSLMVDVEFCQSRLVDVRRVGTGGRSTETIELPVVKSRAFVSSARVAPGGGFVVSAGKPERKYFLRFVTTAPPTDVALENLLVVPIGGLVQSSVPLQSLHLSGPVSSDPSDDSEGRSLVSQDWIIELLQSVAGEGWHDNPRNAIDALEGHLLIRSENASKRMAMLESLRAFEKTIAKNCRVEVRVVDAGGQNSGVQSSERLVDVATSSLIGRPFRCVYGTEHAYVRDHNLEIAQKAHEYATQIGLDFEGLVFDGQVSELGSGKLGLRASLHWSAGINAGAGIKFKGSVRRDKDDKPRSLTIESRRQERTRHHLSLITTSGEWTQAALFDSAAGPRAVYVRISR